MTLPRCLTKGACGAFASPEGGVLDSQTVKAPAAQERGFDGGKRIVGRKRHIAVDTDGRLPMVISRPPISPTAPGRR